jgi:hypothetical protein
MKDLSEEELDDFFQKSLGRKQIPFNPKAWEKMETKLEAERKKRLLVKRLWLWLPLLLISFTIVIYQLATIDKPQNVDSQSENIDNKQITKSKRQSMSSDKPSKSIDKNNIQEIKDNNNGVAETSVSNDRRNFNQLSPSSQLFLNEQTKDKSAKPSDSKIQMKSDGTSDLSQVRNSTQAVNKQEVADTEKAHIEKQNTQNKEQEIEASNDKKTIVFIDSILLIDRELQVSKLDSFKKIEIAYVIYEPNKSIKPKINFSFGRVNVGLLLSPDWSSVKFQNINQTGYKLGFEIEYQPFRRLSVSTAAIFTRLLYNADGGEYTAPYGYWTPTRKPPEKIWGACDALEVPINLRYALFENRKNRFFVSTGISSYWMLSESYKYEYYATKPYLVDGWRGKNKNTHYLSIANLSLGYAGKLAQRIFWQVEPFVKLPLGGVGWGQINLSSTGMFLSIRYQVVK